jgi:hypothetical protein
VTGGCLVDERDTKENVTTRATILNDLAGRHGNLLHYRVAENGTLLLRYEPAAFLVCALNSADPTQIVNYIPVPVGRSRADGQCEIKNMYRTYDTAGAFITWVVVPIEMIPTYTVKNFDLFLKEALWQAS